MSRRFATACAVLAIGAVLRAQTPPTSGTVPLTPPPPGVVDNVKGNWIDFETSPVAPIVVDSPLGAYLAVANPAGLRVEVFYLPTNGLVAEIPTGPGIVSLAQRPNSSELWGVDSVTHSVVVIDVLLQTLSRTIPVGKEPHGIAFLPSGMRAYVACSASDRVDVIDAATYSVVASVPTVAPLAATPLYLSTPHAVAYQNGKIWVAALHSGNNTTAKRDPSLPATVHATHTVVSLFAEAASVPGTNLLPDQDVLAIDPATDTVVPALTVTGVGTTLLNLHARPGTNQLWIPHTEAFNAMFRGEKNFVGGRVVQNRITVVDTQTGGKSFIDLDRFGANQTIPVGCAQPAAIAFDASQGRAYVAAYGSDLVAVLDANTHVWIGHYAIPPSTPSSAALPARSGPRGLALSASGNELYVYNKADASYSRISLTGGPVLGGTAGAAIPFHNDPTPIEVKRGRGHAINADHSLSRTSSCASCHVDGGIDRLVWELSGYSDPDTTASSALTFERDVKGPMATQSLRGLFEAGPYHWRGEKRTLDEFNSAFVGLLKRPTQLTQPQFDDLKAYVFSLVYPSNPRQDPSRAYVGNESLGLGFFQNQPAEISNGTCVGCHTLPLGSSTDLQQTPIGAPALSSKVAQLRGVADKLGPVFQVGGQIGNRTATGFGLIHSGSIESLLAFVQDPVFPNFTATHHGPVVAFLNAFDTGLAPSTAFQATLHPSDPALAATTTAVLAYALGQANPANNCDVILCGTMPLGGGLGTPFTAAYDHTTGQFQWASAGVQFPPSTVLAHVQTTGTPVTVLGLPLGMGWRWGVDRDNDALLDLDESTYGTSPINPDFDGDKLPDGHEVKNGSSPTVFTTTSPDTTAPQFTNAVSVIWSTTNALKLEFSTDEPTQATLSFGTLPLTTASPSPRTGGFDINHAIVLGQLPGGQSGTITVHVVDPAGNASSQNVSVSTMPRTSCARVKSIVFGAFDPVTSTLPVTVTVELLFPGPSPAIGYQLDAFAYLDVGGTLSVISQHLAGTTLATSRFVFAVPIPAGGPVNGRLLHFGVRDAAAPAGSPPYVEAEDLVNFSISPAF